MRVESVALLTLAALVWMTACTDDAVREQPQPPPERMAPSPLPDSGETGKREPPRATSPAEIERSKSFREKLDWIVRMAGNAANRKPLFHEAPRSIEDAVDSITMRGVMPVEYIEYKGTWIISFSPRTPLRYHGGYALLPGSKDAFRFDFW